MDRDLLPHLAIILAVARRGGFGAAAAELGMSPSAVSHAVKTVEDRHLLAIIHEEMPASDAAQRGGLASAAGAPGAA